MVLYLVLALHTDLLIAWLLQRVLRRRGGTPLGYLGALVVPVSVVTMWVRQVGPFGWFTLPSWVFAPVLNWIVLAGWLWVGPVRNLVGLLMDLLENQRLIADARELPSGLRDSLEQCGLAEAALAARRSSPPRVLLHPKLDEPRAIGYWEGVRWREAILVPATWVPEALLGSSPYWSSYSFVGVRTQPKTETELFVYVLHELGHLSAGDTFRAFLIGVGMLFIPTESWNPRPRVALPGPLRQALAWWGAPIRGFLRAELDTQEALADAFAFRLHHAAQRILTATTGRLAGCEGDRPEAWRQALGLLIWIGIGCGLVVVQPGAAFIARSLGGRGEVWGALPAGWETERWGKSERKPAQKNTGRWGYLPPTQDVPGRVLLQESSDSEYLFLTSTFRPVRKVEGPCVLVQEWEVEVLRGDIDGALDCQLIVWDSEDERTRGAYRPFNPRRVAELVKVGPGHYRSTTRVEVPSGMCPNVMNVVWTVGKPLLVLIHPPRLRAETASGRWIELGA